MGDEGSAFWIGREFLRLRYQINPDISIIRPYVVGKNPVATIAALAKKAVRIAQKRPSSYERRIVNEAMIHLRDLVKEVRFRLKLSPSTPIHLTGGLFENRFFRTEWRKFLSRA